MNVTQRKVHILNSQNCPQSPHKSTFTNHLRSTKANSEFTKCLNLLITEQNHKPPQHMYTPTTDVLSVGQL